ncbi:MAG: hypothetical protein C4527_01125 [Candidatus Omnitrophota bacterium]|jgi:hypothetical protein|nr:MAG: hypothetical protein C4527_01125 [Candidatus Omnitrophota bacterium]
MSLLKLETAIWQISGGPSSRSYADQFLKYGVSLIGPGDAGPWKPERSDDAFQGSVVRRFANEMKVDDIILLRTGLSSISALGIVASDYLYLNQFDEVNGWDLQHARRIRWCKLPDEYKFDTQVFGGNPSRFSRILDDNIRFYVEQFLNSPPTDWQDAPLPELPEEESSLDEIPKCLEDIVGQALDLTSMYLDQQNFGDLPTEDEMVVHFVVPFFQAFGWSPESIAVKWKYIDVALFHALPRTPAHCQFVIEAKRIGAGVEGALEQAKGYMVNLGIQGDVIVTDGIRYRMYSGQNDFEPIAYANLVRLKRSATEFFERIKQS